MNKKKALVKKDESPKGNSLMDIIERATKDPNVDVNKLHQLVDLNIKMMEKQAEIDFNQAMTRLQRLLPTVHKKGVISFTDKNGVVRETPFAKYEDIHRAIQPLLTKHNFSVSFNTYSDDKIFMKATLSHISGHSRSAEMRLPLDTSGSKNNLQAAGSTISYAKRYLVCMLLNIVTTDEDDDAKTHIDEKETDEFQKMVEQEESQTWNKEILFIDGIIKPMEDAFTAFKEVITELERLKTKQERQNFVNENLTFLKHLAEINKKDKISQIHDLVDRGL